MDLEKKISELEKHIKEQKTLNDACKIQINTAFGSKGDFTPRMMETLADLTKFKTDVVKDIREMSNHRSELIAKKIRQDRINQILK